MAKRKPNAARLQDASAKRNDAATSTAVVDSSNQALLRVLQSLKTESDPAEVRRLSDQLERIIFHKQYDNA